MLSPKLNISKKNLQDSLSGLSKKKYFKKRIKRKIN